MRTRLTSLGDYSSAVGVSNYVDGRYSSAFGTLNLVDNDTSSAFGFANTSQKNAAPEQISPLPKSELPYPATTVPPFTT